MPNIYPVLIACIADDRAPDPVEVAIMADVIRSDLGLERDAGAILAWADLALRGSPRCTAAHL